MCCSFIQTSLAGRKRGDGDVAKPVAYGVVQCITLSAIMRTCTVCIDLYGLN